MYIFSRQTQRGLKVNVYVESYVGVFVRFRDTLLIIYVADEPTRVLPLPY